MTKAQEPTDYFSTIHVTASTEGNTAPASSAPSIDPQVSELLRQLVQQNQELLTLARRQCDLAQRMDDRYEQQIKAQRDEFLRWIDEVPGLSARGKKASDAVRVLLGQIIEELVEYVDDHRDEIQESDYMRGEMVDRYGQQLNHLSSLYGVLKRLATAEDGLPGR